MSYICPILSAEFHTTGELEFKVALSDCIDTKAGTVCVIPSVAASLTPCRLRGVFPWRLLALLLPQLLLVAGVFQFVQVGCAFLLRAQQDGVHRR